MANGWTGNILRVNLTTGNITLEDSSKFKSFVGGMGFGYKIMYDEVPPGTKPFDEANKLVFATGPLTGSGAPCSSRVNITSLSTFTKGNLVVDAHMGGFFAAQMKFAGYDVIIIEGKAKSPVWLKIKDDKVCYTSVTTCAGHAKLFHPRNIHLGHTTDRARVAAAHFYCVFLCRRT